MSSSSSKRPRTDETQTPATAEEAQAAAPTNLQEALAQSVDAMEVLESILPVPDKAFWIIMFENGTWIKSALEKIQRVLPDVGVFTIDFVMHTVQDGKGDSFEVPYYFLMLCQELKERNGVAFF